MAATAVGIDAIEGVDALSAITPAKLRAIPVLRDDIGFLLSPAYHHCETCYLNGHPGRLTGTISGDLYGSSLAPLLSGP
jgi:hypothetical protein